MEKLGIDLWGLLAQIVNFLIVFWLLKKFLYGPVLKILHERKAKITQSLEQVKQIEDRLAKVETAVQDKLKQARSEGQEILKQAKKTGEDIRKEAQHQAEQQAKLILEKADVRIQDQERQLLKTLETKVNQTAISILEKTLTELDTDTRKKITQKTLHQAAHLIS